MLRKNPGRTMNDNELLTVEEVARELKVHANLVRKWINKEGLVAIDIGREYRISRANLNKFLAERQTDQQKKR